MKNKISLLAILLGTGALMPSTKSFAAGYLTVTNKPCQVWFGGQSNPNISMTWTGPCSTNGKASGKGILELFDSGKLIEHHEGTLIDGKYNGKGTTTWPDGSRYEGDYKNDQKEGRGIFTWSNGSRYEGEFKEGFRTGFGKISVSKTSSTLSNFNGLGNWVGEYYVILGLFEKDKFLFACKDAKACQTQKKAQEEKAAQELKLKRIIGTMLCLTIKRPYEGVYGEGFHPPDYYLTVYGIVEQVLPNDKVKIKLFREESTYPAIWRIQRAERVEGQQIWPNTSEKVVYVDPTPWNICK